MDGHTTMAPLATSATGIRLAAGALRAGGVIGGIGLVFLIAMYAAFAAGELSLGLTLGWVNDMTGWMTPILTLPAIVAIHRLVRGQAPTASAALLVVGVGSSAAIVVLQVALVTKVLTFEQQIGPVTVAFLGLATWFVGTGYLGRRAGSIPDGARWGLFAGLYAGYPFWAFRTARILERQAGSGG